MRIDTSRFVSDLSHLESQIREAIKRGLNATTIFALETARATRAFKDRTGAARGSINSGTRSEFAAFVQAGGRAAPHVLWLEEGSRAHAIQAKNVKMLRFVQEGRIRFAKRVWHPGTKGTHFMQDARDRAEQAATHLFETEINAVVR